MPECKICGKQIESDGSPIKIKQRRGWELAHYSCAVEKFPVLLVDVYDCHRKLPDIIDLGTQLLRVNIDGFQDIMVSKEQFEAIKNVGIDFWKAKSLCDNTEDYRVAPGYIDQVPLAPTGE